MAIHNPADTVRDALTRVTSILLDLEDQLAHTTGEEPRPRVWAAALDDFHAVVVELAKLAAIVQGHYNRWERANADADRGELAGAIEALEALGHAWEALTEAVKVIGTARNSSIHQPADGGAYASHTEGNTRPNDRASG